MRDVNWKDDAVCYFAKKQWFPNNGALGGMLKGYIHHYNYGDFQLNEIRIGDFIPASELDTEQKYNEVVEVFELFGFEKWEYSKGFANLKPRTHLGIDNDGEILAISTSKKRQLTHSQIIAIGKLKRMMLEREKSKLIENASMMKQLRNSELDDGLVITKPKRRNKSKQAYDILKSLDYEYDLVKQRWFKKQYID